jgi:CheY-like chemotaxis protein
LAIIRKLIDRLGGVVEVWSEIGVGTKVKVSLPFGIVDPVSEGEVVEELFEFSGLTILVVDDDTVGLKLLKLLLESKGARVIDFGGGLSWRENFKEQHLDAAILDIQMPEVSGLDVLLALRSNPKYKRLPILAMTANVFANEEFALGKQGFDGVILKPFDEKYLFSEIDKAFGINRVSKKDPKPTDIHSLDRSGLFDLNDIRRFCMGDEQMAQEVIQDLVQSIAIDLDSLQKASMTAQYLGIKETCHQLGSRLAQIKAPCFGKAREIELALGQGRFDGAKEKIEDLIPDLERLLYSLRKQSTQEVIR